MKNSIFALLVLLVALIVACVYEKTYTLYSTSPQKLTLVERNTTTQSISTVKTDVEEEKEQKTSVLPIVSALSAEKPAENESETRSKPVQEDKSVVKTEDVIATEEKEAKKETVPSAKDNSATSNVAALMKKEETSPKPAATQKPETVAQEAKKEIVDYIMWALKNREIALKNRDEVEARIEALITKAFNDRKVVLDERSSNEITLQKMQKELIDARDASYESIINPKTIHQGEK